MSDDYYSDFEDGDIVFQRTFAWACFELLHSACLRVFEHLYRVSICIRREVALIFAMDPAASTGMGRPNKRINQLRAEVHAKEQEAEKLAAETMALKV